MKHYPSRLLKERAEILMDTLLNYLTEKILKEIRQYPSEIRYFILKANLREKVRNWALSDSNKFKPSFLKIKEEESTLEKTLNIVPGLAVSIGGLLAIASNPETFILKAIPGASSFFGPFYIYKKIKEKNQRLKKAWKKQIHNYLAEMEKELKNWLIKIIEKFSQEINSLQLEIEKNYPAITINKNLSLNLFSN